jgi:hypothetical protein
MPVLKQSAAAGKAGVECLPVAEAARRLGVSCSTIREWVRSGKLEPVEKHLVVTCVRSGRGAARAMRVTCDKCDRAFAAGKLDLAVFCIRASSLERALYATCRYCGQSFRAKHPRKAQFCRAEHRDAWHNRKRRQALKQAKAALGA